jgi:uncharacterized protein (TIGR02302 family)
LAEPGTDRLGKTIADPLKAIAGRLALTRAGLGWERLWPRLVTPFCILGLYLSAAWLGLFARLPDWPRLVLVGLLALAFLASLLPLLQLRRPTSAEALRRLEEGGGLTHRPLTALSDDLAAGGADPAGRALWLAHRRRLASAIGPIAVQPPSPRVDRRDPYALRAAVFLAVLVAVIAARHDLVGPLAASVALPAVEQPPVRLDAWATPPDYTGLPAVFLTGTPSATETQTFEVPAGSRLVVRVAGLEEPATVFTPDAGDAVALPVEDAEPGSATRSFAADLVRSGTVAVTADDETVAAWTFRVRPDEPPTIRLVGEPTGTIRGALHLAYEIADDYGATSARAVISPAEGAAGDARPLYPAPEFALSLPRASSETGAAEIYRDLSSHPWAGGEVALRLEATDAAGNVGFADAGTVLLPIRPFRDPLARALVEQRGILARDAGTAPAVADVLDTMTLHPGTFFDDAGIFLGLTAAHRRLVAARDDDQLRAVADLLWEMALAIDGGDAAAAEERLREAREALREALQNDAPPEEIARLVEELQEALDAYMQALAEQMNTEDMQAAPQRMPDGQVVTPEDLQSLAEQIQELSELGDREAAEQLLSQLDAMLENLQTARPRQGQGAPSPENELMNELGEMIQRQQELMDETYRLSPDGEGGEMTPQELADALADLEQRQQQLGDQLGEMMQRLREEGLEPGDALGEAGRSMDRAGRELGRGDSPGAVGEQGQALEELRQGARQLGQQMAGEGQNGGQGQGQARPGGGSDPLGRPQRTRGPDAGDDVRVPDEIDRQRARRILEELRRRFGERTRPEQELDYLDRLLEPF